jgi:hypothetical protein
MIRLIVWSCLLFLTATPKGYAQEEHAHQEVTEEHAGRTAVYEIITSGIYVYIPESGHGAFGTEFHFTYWMNHVWGAGLGYTVLYLEENENIHQLAFLGSYNPVSWLTINAGPNLTFPHGHRDLIVSGYVETEFNYRPKEWVHFGPVLGINAGKELELVVGFHLGFEF